MTVSLNKSKYHLKNMVITKLTMKSQVFQTVRTTGSRYMSNLSMDMYTTAKFLKIINDFHI